MCEQRFNNVKLLQNQFKYNEALDEIRNIEQTEKLTDEELLSLIFLKSTICNELERFEDGLIAANQLLEESRALGNQLRELDAVINKVWASQWLGNLQEGLKLIKRAEDLLEKLSRDQQVGLKGRRASLHFHKGLLYWKFENYKKAFVPLETSLQIYKELGDKKGIGDSLFFIGQSYLWIGEVNRALEYFPKSLLYAEEIGDNRSIAWTLHKIGYSYWMKGELDRALEFFQKSLTKSEAIGFQHLIGENFNGFGLVYNNRGELIEALEYFQKCLTIQEAIGIKFAIARSYNNIGEMYDDMGDVKMAINYLERALNLSKEIESHGVSAEVLYQLIRRFCNTLSPGTITDYLNELGEINKKLENSLIDQQYRLANAMVLKTSDRLPDKMEAFSIFKQVTEEEILKFESTVHALLNQGELLIFEFQTTGSKKALNEVKNLSNRILSIAKEKNSLWLLAETYLLQSKFALIELNINYSQELITQAQFIADENGFQRLSKKITQDRDTLLQQMDIWHEYSERKAPLKDRLELIQLEDMIEQMLYRKLYLREEEMIKYAAEAQKLAERIGEDN